MAGRALVAVLAHNEASTIAAVIESLRREAQGFDLLVVNDGSRDATGEIVARLGVPSARHLCNLGYGRAVQTAMKYAMRHGYGALITFDADGQHRAADVAHVYRTFVEHDYDLVIGSRFLQPGQYRSSAWNRRIGMWIFSGIVRALTGRRIHDTSSGFRVIGTRTFGILTAQPFVDFHAEAVVLLLRHGYKVGEAPIVASERVAGSSM
jgi:glycosyltransferase involved in cell wall biosynthesis